MAVAEAKVHARRGFEDLARGRGLALADLRRAARTEFAARDVDDADRHALRARLQQQPAAAELRVVRVRGEDQDVDL
jgi:hypothetical protein